MAYNPPIGSIYHLHTTYILPSDGLYATYHLLGEPETTIEKMISIIQGIQVDLNLSLISLKSLDFQDVYDDFCSESFQV